MSLCEVVECHAPQELRQKGKVLARVQIFDDAVPSSIHRLSATEAEQQGEAEVQLRENGRYEYVLMQAGRASNEAAGNLRLQCSLSQRSPSCRNDEDRGRLETGSHCGLLRLDVTDGPGGPIIASGFAEVRSVKLNYRDEYRWMLDDLSERMMALLFDVRSSSQMRLTTAWKDEPRYLQQQIAFLREMLAAPYFRAAVQRVVAHPHRQLDVETQQQPIQKPFKPDPKLTRQFASGAVRQRLPNTHPLAQRLLQRGIRQPSLPASVLIETKTDDLDTSENQFVKFVLSELRDFLDRAAALLQSQKDVDWHIAAQQAAQASAQLSQWLGQSFFRGLSALRTVPQDSPVLQRKAGYREILQAWLRFQANCALAWNASDDVFHAGKRDVAKLYEYWLFFRLLDWFCDHFGNRKLAAQELVKETDEGLTVQLRKSITAGPFEGLFASNQRRLYAQFHYNKAFVFQPNREIGGSWTRKMQPDYTLTFWPANYTLSEAEAQELVVHIHLDAKYRVDKLEDLFHSAEEDAANANETSRNAKRADLLKMHAYRDAVRRSEGAYVLYPGNDQDRAKQWRVGDEVHSNSNMLFGFHEILPGLGAFAISPGPNGQAKGLAQLQSFLDAVLEHLCNRATQREQRAYHVFDAKRVAETHPPAVRRTLRERDDAGYRAEPPYEHLIIATWYEREDELAWMLTKGRAVLRLGQRRGALPIVKKLAAASHMLFRSHASQTQSGLFSILEEAGQVLTRSEMIALGYPDNNRDPDHIFAVFAVQPDPAYQDWRWDGNKLNDAIEAYEKRRKPLYKNLGRDSALPRILSLGDVINALM